MRGEHGRQLLITALLLIELLALTANRTSYYYGMYRFPRHRNPSSGVHAVLYQVPGTVRG
jgi:hypothetical protein